MKEMVKCICDNLQEALDYAKEGSEKIGKDIERIIEEKMIKLELMPEEVEAIRDCLKDKCDKLRLDQFDCKARGWKDAFYQIGMQMTKIEIILEKIAEAEEEKEKI